jgi:hypothetical protein
MTTPAAHPRKGSAQEGFVLVGVIVFTLALTILSLSLFSLSGFEAQFWNHSMEEEQAFYYAVGGLERAKMILAAKDSLALVAVPPGNPVEGVVYARALQIKGINEDSTRYVKWDPESLITIRAQAVYKRARRTVEAQYAPSKQGDMYRYLISVSSPINTAIKVRGVYYEDNSATDDRMHHTAFTGSVWQANTSQASIDSWRDSVASPMGPGNLVNVRTGGALPRPDLNTYWSRYGSAEPIVKSNGDILSLDAGAAPGAVKYFREAPPSYSDLPTTQWGVNRSDVTLDVRGIAVWMLNRGVRCAGRVTVRQDPPGPGPHALIIVARPNSPQDPDEPPEAGIAFVGSATFAAMGYPPVPTFLVSDGCVSLEQKKMPSTPSNSYYLSIYANNVVIMGPRGSIANPVNAPHMELKHPISIATNTLLDVLYNLGVLPNTTAGQRASFQQKPGRWREIPPN